MPDSFGVLVVMGVSGSGKSLVGEGLAQALGLPFFDGDDFHPPENIQKMAASLPLDDRDREGWLIALNRLAREHRDRGAVIACSALKKAYRELLGTGMGERMRFVHLAGSLELIKSRLQARKGHFMPLDLLQSQFDTLEPPGDALTVQIDKPPAELVQEILKQLK